MIAFGASACRAEPVELDGAAFEIKRFEVGPGDNAVLFRDFNNDGFLDLAAATESQSSVAIMLGDGKGGLSDPRSFSAGDNPASLDSADINSDGRLDLVIANHESPYLTLLLGDGSGGFAAAKNSPVQLTVTPHPHMVKAEDLDQDGHVDLIVDSRDEFGVFVLRGLGQGTFDAPGIGINVEGAPYLGFAIGDINGDKRPDLVTPNARDVSVMLSVNSSPLAFNRSQSVIFASPFAVELADMNGDGHLDLIVASNQGGSSVGVFLGNGSGQFSIDADATFRVATGAKSIAIGDINGDGLSDAVVSSWNSDVRIIYGDASDFTSTELPLGELETPWGVAIGDLNGDGRDDLIVTDGVSSVANLYLSRPGSE